MRSLGWVLFALAMSCGASARPGVATPIPVQPLPEPKVAETPPPVPSVAPSSSASFSSGPPKFVAAQTPSVVVPSNVACAIESKKVPAPIGLYTRADAGHFATINSGAARLVIPTTGAAIGEVVLPGAELRGFVRSVLEAPYDLAPVVLHASAPLVLSGVFSVAPNAKIGWGDGGTIGTIAPVVVGLDLFEAQPIAPVPCQRFTLDTVKFDAKSMVPKGKFAPKTRLLTADRLIPIAINATDAPIGNLSKHYGLTRVQEIDSASGRSLFVVTLDQGVLFGWVSSKDLEPDQKVMKPLVGTGAGLQGYGHKIISHPAVYDATCGHDVKIVADLSEGATSSGNVPFTYVGTIRAGTLFRYRSTGEALNELWGSGLVLPGVSIARGSLSVSVAELADCARTKAAE